MRHALATLATCAALSTSLGACTSDDAPAADTPTTPTAQTSSSTPPAPTSPPPNEPAAPVMPALAQEQSPAGAKAFVRYYIEVLNHAWQAESGDGIRRLASEDCKTCQDFAKAVDRTIARGGGQSGGEWRIDAFAMVPAQPTSRPILLPRIRVAQGTWKKSQTSKPIPIEAQTLNYEFFLVWTGRAWLMDAVKL